MSSSTGAALSTSTSQVTVAAGQVAETAQSSPHALLAKFITDIDLLKKLADFSLEGNNDLIAANENLQHENVALKRHVAQLKRENAQLLKLVSAVQNALPAAEKQQVANALASQQAAH